MTAKLRWGILGTGNMARQFSAEMLKSDRGDVVSVGSRGKDTAEAFAREFHIQRAAAYDDVLADPDVDAVYNSLPNSMHHSWTILALRSGKHVLCEKPFAADLRESEEMFEAAKKAGRVVVEAFMYRSHPLTHAVLDAVGNGAIGKLRLIRTSFCYSSARIAGIRFQPDLAGGALMDIGCYCINYSRLFAGQEPEKVFGTAHIHETGVDDVAAATMIFPNGIIASFTCGMTVQADNTAYLYGDEGFIQIPIPWKPPMHGAEFTISRGAEKETRYVDAGSPSYALEADDFAATVLNGRPPAVSREDTLGNMRVLDQLRKR